MKVRDAYRLAVRFIGYGATLLLVGGAIAVHLTGYVMAHDESLWNESRNGYASRDSP